MPESMLPRQMAEERARAVRILLGRPLLDVNAHHDEFHLVARHRDWLVEWFESSCGWHLVVEVSSGFARLAKRGQQRDGTRGVRRTRGSGQLFDRRRYELLCMLCAELASRAMTTIGILASDLTSSRSPNSTGLRLDTTLHRDRVAFVDALKLLESWGILRFEAGDVDAYVNDASANAIVAVDAGRLHRMIATATTPSAIAAATTAEAIERLAREPRYGDAPSDPLLADEEQRLRWTRHSLLRRIVDDPVVYLDDLSPGIRDYLANPAGRRWLRDRVSEAGFELEERAEGLIAIDPDELATDLVFPDAGGTVKQTALLLVDQFVVDGRLVPHERNELVAYVRRLLAGHPNWAKEFRDDAGASRLLNAAIELLGQIGLIVADTTQVRPRPAIARYGVASPGEDQRSNTKEAS